MNSRNSSLLSRFLKGKSSSKEAAKIIRDLNEETYSDSEWNEWNEADQSPIDQKIEIPPASLIVGGDSQGKIISIRTLKVAAAACLILCSSVFSYWLLSKPESKPAVAESTKAKVEFRINNGNEKMLITLADNSVVTLYPNSVIRFNTDSMLNSNKRNIILSGSAHFEVAKNPEKPFTVFSGSIYTTALGTSFEVLENHGKHTVTLFTGKVVVGENVKQSWKDVVYLNPGEKVNAEGIKSKLERSKPALAVKKETKLSVESNTPIMKFDNAPLADVFKLLDKTYHHRIIFDTTNTRQLYFSGELYKTDSLPVILKIISNMNALRVSDSSGVFLIRK